MGGMVAPEDGFLEAQSRRHGSMISLAEGLGQQTPFLQAPLSRLDGAERPATTQAVDDDWASPSLIPTSLLLWIAGTVLFMYFGTLLVFVQECVAIWATLVTTILIPIASFISMRFLRETDDGAALRNRYVLHLFCASSQVQPLVFTHQDLDRNRTPRTIRPQTLDFVPLGVAMAIGDSLTLASKLVINNKMNGFSSDNILLLS